MVGAQAFGVANTPGQQEPHEKVNSLIVFVLVFGGIGELTFFLRLLGPQPELYVVSAPLSGDAKSTQGKRKKKKVYELASRLH